MGVTADEIGKEAMDAAEEEFDGIVMHGKMYSVSQGEYDPETSQRAVRLSENFDSFRFVFAGKQKDNQIGTYTIKDGEFMIICQGVSSEPEIGSQINYDDLGTPSFSNTLGLIGDARGKFNRNLKQVNVLYWERIGGGAGVYNMVIK